MRLFLWCFSLALVFLFSWMIWGGGWASHFSMDGSVDFLTRTGPWAWAAGIGLLTSDIILPIPGTVVMSALGFIYGPMVGGIVAAAGSMAAGLTGYGIGRCFGEPTARRLLGNLDFENGRLLFTKGGGWMVALSRALPVLPEVISCTAGLVRMPLRRFVVSLACGSLPIGFLFAGIGAAGHEAPAWALVFSLLVPAILWIFAKKWLA